jgi:hypothetical protein
MPWGHVRGLVAVRLLGRLSKTENEKAANCQGFLRVLGHPWTNNCWWVNINPSLASSMGDF